MVTAIRRFIDALLTALAVVVGLQPDPSRVPVPVRFDRDSIETQ